MMFFGPGIPWFSFGLKWEFIYINRKIEFSFAGRKYIDLKMLK
jgi:hypothetical protein